MFITATLANGLRVIINLSEISCVREKAGTVGCFVALRTHRDAVQLRDSYDDMERKIDKARRHG